MHRRSAENIRHMLAVFVLLMGSLGLVTTGSLASDFFKNSDAPRLPPLPPPTDQQLQNRAIAEVEHQREMKALGITALRPSHDARDPDAPNAVNYDEAFAVSYPRPSDVLRMNNGERVTTAAKWWKARRPEILSEFTRVFYGRVPDNVPSVKWTVVDTKDEVIGGIKAVTRHLRGHVDNSLYPAVSVDIDVVETLPVKAKGPVPLIVNLVYDRSYDRTRLLNRGPDVPGPDWQAQILALGWGYAAYDPNTVQADNPSALNRGIIGLVNKGGPRNMDQWGAVRAWAWGASQVMDYLKTDPRVDGGQIGIAGHSRFGKAALVAMAYDERFAITYLSSPGAGGAKLLSRNFGETIEDLMSSGEYFWFAGNLMNYAADPLTTADLPVDADALIALCAPRPVFLGAGSVAAGDAWTDPKGMFLAAAGAGPVYRLLGKKDLGTDKFPPMDTALVEGELAYRQHRYNHNPTPNWPYFLNYAQRYLHIAKGASR